MGNVISSATSSATTLESLILTEINPFRYRGYYYDRETGWYYLQSRYYNPEWGRFLNADAFVTTGQGLLSYNMFAYCGNNPINFIDPFGEWSWKTVGYIVAGIAVAALTATVVACGVGCIIGAVTLVSESVITTAVGIGIGAGTLAGTVEVIDQALKSEGEEFNMLEVIKESGSASAEAVFDHVLLNGGSTFGEFLLKHETAYEFTKNFASYAKNYIGNVAYNLLKGNNPNDNMYKVNEESLPDIIINVFKVALTSAFSDD